MSSMNPEMIIWNALRGALVTRALGLVAELRVAQALAEGPRSHEALARERDVNADALYRVLRALASDGIFKEVEPGVFGNTAASEMLVRGGWDDFAHLFGGTWLQAVAALDASGEPSFPRAHGDEYWAWLAAHPDERAAFDRAMAQGWQTRIDRLESIGWRGDELVVDVGGGNGSLLVALLERHPRMHGIVFDLPETVRDERALGDRCTFVEGSFFEEVPRGDAHLLSTILHDWDDHSAQRILETVRARGRRAAGRAGQRHRGRQRSRGCEVARPADAHVGRRSRTDGGAMAGTARPGRLAGDKRRPRRSRGSAELVPPASHAGWMKRLVLPALQVLVDLALIHLMDPAAA